MTVLAAPTADGSPLSLAQGAAGIALLRIEQALTGSGTWADAHSAVRQAAAMPVDASPAAGLFYGAPALAFALHAACADGRARYQAATQELDGIVQRTARQRAVAGIRRLERGDDGAFREYDLFHGLTGIGALLLRTSPDSDALAEILRYLTLLTRPQAAGDSMVPGWWAGHDPDPLMPTPGGHANLGMAHGAAGILAFLSLATVAGRTVDGQGEAIGTLAAFFDRWRQDSPDGPWWPQWLTRADLLAGCPTRPRPGRASWCYGAPGIARALQLAAIATADHARQADAERDLAASLAGPQFATLTEVGLCHGIAGAYQTAVRAAADAITPAITACLPAVSESLTASAATVGSSPGLLTGTAGAQLVLETLRRSTLPISGWDSCLLLA
jgi:hypothetical protein